MSLSLSPLNLARETLPTPTLDQVTSGTRRTTPVTLNKTKNGRLADILQYYMNLSHVLPRQTCLIGHAFKVEGRGTRTTVTSESISPTLKGHHFWLNATRIDHIHLHCWIWLFPSKALCVCKFGILCWHEFRMLILSRVVRV